MYMYIAYFNYSMDKQEVGDEMGTLDLQAAKVSVRSITALPILPV